RPAQAYIRKTPRQAGARHRATDRANGERDADLEVDLVPPTEDRGADDGHRHDDRQRSAVGFTLGRPEQVDHRRYHDERPAPPSSPPASPVSAPIASRPAARLISVPPWTQFRGALSA